MRHCLRTKQKSINRDRKIKHRRRGTGDVGFQHKEASALGKAGPWEWGARPKARSRGEESTPKQVIKAESKLFQWRHRPIEFYLSLGSS